MGGGGKRKGRAVGWWEEEAKERNGENANERGEAGIGSHGRDWGLPRRSSTSKRERDRGEVFECLEGKRKKACLFVCFVCVRVEREREKRSGEEETLIVATKD